MGVKDHAVLQIQRRTRVSELRSGEASPGLPEPSCTIGSSWFLLDVCYLEGGGSRPRLDIKSNNIASGLPSSDVRVSMETDFRGVVLFLSNGEKSGVVFKPRL